MNLKEIKIKTYKDLRDFLNEQSEDILSESVQVMIGDGEQTETISLIEILTEDHINPSGECLEPLSNYLEGGVYYNNPDAHDLSFEDIQAEPIVKRKGEFFLVVL